MPVSPPQRASSPARVDRSGLQSPQPPPTRLPLCVDLDGTLVKSDTLYDSCLVLARQRPELLLHFPAWVMAGKAAFKRKVTGSIELDVEHLPYNRELLAYLIAEAETGREIYLATGADEALAERISAHVGIFQGVLASNGKLNLIGGNKLAAFEQRFLEGFSYIGNASPDLRLLAACTEPMVANPDQNLTQGLRAAGVVPARTFTDRTGTAKSWLKAIRLHQWAKNTLIFLPLVLAHRMTGSLWVAAVLAFIAFGLCASATYIVNDLLDLDADRRHARKRRRPFAAGDLSPAAGVAVVLAFLVAAFSLALTLPFILRALSPDMHVSSPRSFVAWLALYAVTTTAYSFRLKRMALVDVVVLSGLYTIRILAGSAATAVPVSTWLAGFSVFFFLSLAFVKRFAELEGLQLKLAAEGSSKADLPHSHRPTSRSSHSTTLPSSHNAASPRIDVPTAQQTMIHGRGYQLSDLEQLRSFGTASGFASVVVLTLYIRDLGAAELYHHTGRLWLLVPILILWICRLWLLASRGELHEDPVVYAITDRRSLLLGALVVAVVWLAM